MINTAMEEADNDGALGQPELSLSKDDAGKCMPAVFGLDHQEFSSESDVQQSRVAGGLDHQEFSSESDIQQS